MTTNMRTAGFVKSHSQSGKGPVIVQVLPALVRGGVERGTIEMARAIIDAFAQPENAEKGAIQVDGKMVERLHAQMAAKTVAMADAIAQRT